MESGLEELQFRIDRDSHGVSMTYAIYFAIRFGVMSSTEGERHENDMLRQHVE
jgi:hypothetical protein